jgi:hypothetical protein
VLPVEGVYGIIEVKSTMTKAEFVDASKKIESFKRLPPGDLSVIQTREYVTVNRPSRPFGIAFGYALGNNSLDSLRSNFDERHREIHDVNYFVSSACRSLLPLLVTERETAASAIVPPGLGGPSGLPGPSQRAFDWGSSSSLSWTSLFRICGGGCSKV